MILSKNNKKIKTQNMKKKYLNINKKIVKLSQLNLANNIRMYDHQIIIHATNRAVTKD